MATRTTLASVPETQVEEFRSGRRDRIEPSAIFGVSHRIAERMEFEPLRTLLGRVLGGGERLEIPTAVGGPCPRLHRALDTEDLASELDQAWSSLRRDPAFQLHRLQDWWGGEVEMISRAFRHAAKARECIVQVFDHPRGRGATLLSDPLVLGR